MSFLIECSIEVSTADTFSLVAYLRARLNQKVSEHYSQTLDLLKIFYALPYFIMDELTSSLYKFRAVGPLLKILFTVISYAAVL